MEVLVPFHNCSRQFNRRRHFQFPRFPDDQMS